MTTIDLIDLVFSPMQQDDPKRFVEADLVDILPPVASPDAPHAVIFSETANNRRSDRYVRPTLIEVAKQGGWDLNLNRSDSTIALNPERGELVAHQYRHLLDGRKQKPGAYSNKGIALTTFITELGNVVTLGSTHLLTAWRNDTTPGPEGRREQMIVDQVDAILEEAEKNGKENNVFFFAGDVNMDDQPGHGTDPDGVYAKFHKGGLITCWDDAGMYPPTHGRRGSTIDVIARYRKDKRVRLVDEPRVGPLRHSDHQWVRATYQIVTADPVVVEPVPVPEPAPTRHECPLCGRDHKILNQS